MTLLTHWWRATRFEMGEYGREIYRYYGYPRFLLADLLLGLFYLGRNPYRLCRRFWQRQGREQPYGETPLTTWAEIVKRARITRDDFVYELGCGRGRGVFWLASVMGCRTLGIELQPTFVAKASAIARWLGLPREQLSFLEIDFFRVNFQPATVLYLYGTTLSDGDIERLLRKVRWLKPGARVITVSYSLLDYGLQGFEPQGEWRGRFPWGETSLYLIRRV